MTDESSYKIDVRSKYEPWMAQKIIELSHYKFINQIAVDLKVTRRTLQNWSIDQRKPEFVEAYTMAKDIIMARLENDAYEMRNDRNSNYRVLEMLLERFSRTQERRALQIPGISNGSLEDRCDIVLKSLEEGEVRPDEFKILMEGMRIYYEITVGQEVINRLKAIEEKIGIAAKK